MSLKTLQDVELFARLRDARSNAPDRGALSAEIHRRYRGRVLAIARRILRAHPSCVEEASQEAWNKFFETFGGSIAGHEVGFLCTVARTVAIDFLRKERHQGGWGSTEQASDVAEASSPDGGRPPDSGAADSGGSRITRTELADFDEQHLPPLQGSSPEVEARHGQVIAFLVECVGTLPDWRWAYVVRAVFGDGCQQNEVAEVLRVTPRTVGNWLHGDKKSVNEERKVGALELLRRCLETKGVNNAKAVFDVR